MTAICWAMVYAKSLNTVRHNTVLTYYWPLSDQEPASAREVALARSLEDWQGYIVRDLLRVHPELEEHIENIDVRVWGHAMIRPTPGFIWGEARRAASVHRPPLYLAHSDLSGISMLRRPIAGDMKRAGFGRRAPGQPSQRQHFQPVGPVASDHAESATGFSATPASREDRQPRDGGTAPVKA